METANALKLLNLAERDTQWFDKNYESLIDDYPDQFIAINEEKIVDADADFQKLLKKLESKRVDPVNVVIRFISKIKVIL